MNARTVARIDAESTTVVAAFVLIAFVYGWFCTFGTWNFFVNDALGRGAAFDSMGRSLLHGQVTVDPRAIQTEAYVVNGKVQMYYGPFPAFLRIVPNLVFANLFGRWARLSVWLAAVVVLCAFASIVLRVAPSSVQTIRGRLILGFALGTPLVFGVASCSIYHEAILWGLAGSMSALCLLLLAPHYESSRGLHYWLVSTCAGIALLSRVSFGVPWAIILGYLTCRRARQYGPRGVLFIVPFVVAVFIQLGVNQLRFGSPFTVLDMRYYTGTIDKVHEPLIVYGSFHGGRIPDTIASYLGFGQNYFSSRFPYIRLGFRHPVQQRLFGYQEPVVPLFVAAPWLLIWIGLACAHVRRRSIDVLSIVCVLALGFEGVIVLSYGVITERYVLEFVPLIVTLMWLGLNEFDRVSTTTRKAITAALNLTVAFSIWASSLSAMAWAAEYWWASPRTYRSQIVHAFTVIDRKVESLGINELHPLPSRD
jgi:hypothetical protein